MKRTILSLAFIGLLLCGANAQQAGKSIPYTVKLNKGNKAAQRTEIILPQVKGFNCYKGDFHIHTMYSDGNVTPAARVSEAWLDGLDILAITDHYEYRKGEKNFLKVIAPYSENGEPIPYQSVKDFKAVKADFNAIHAEAAAQMEKSKYPMLLIKGCEMARNAQSHGHFNCLFLKDANGLYDEDMSVAFRRVHAQGGIVIHNHPGWRRETTDKTEFHEKVYGEGLIDGVEIMNGAEFYPKAIDRAIKHNLFVTACTDIHFTTADTYGRFGAHRNMTIIFAKDNSLESLREALEAKRTLAYSYGVLAGREELLKKFVTACLDMEFIANDYKNRPLYKLTNNSSVEFCYRVNGSNLRSLPANSSVTVRLDKGKTTFDIEFTSAWCDSKKFLAFTVDPANWNKK